MFSLKLRTCYSIRTSVFCSLRYQVHVVPARVAIRTLATAPPRRPVENLNVGHSTFLAESSSQAKWRKDANVPGNGGLDPSSEELPDDKGKIFPTSSHLFKLILPMYKLRPDGIQKEPPTVFLLHPSQPLSHISRLIAASLTPGQCSISFRSTSPRGRQLQWSDSTDVGDFIRDAARATEFEIYLQAGHEERRLHVEIPTFADRTRFLRHRLQRVDCELKHMEELKRRCDIEARHGARRMALGGLGMLVVYWGTVTRLTFWDLGWDVMEPVTYLSSLSMVIVGYLWFLYQGREVSYSSVLDRSISSRQQALYKAYDFDIERWIDLVNERKTLRREMNKIAEDYDERRWRQPDEGGDDSKEDQNVEEMKKIVEEAAEAESARERGA